MCTTTAFPCETFHHHGLRENGEGAIIKFMLHSAEMWQSGLSFPANQPTNKPPFLDRTAQTNKQPSTEGWKASLARVCMINNNGGNGDSNRRLFRPRATGKLQGIFGAAFAVMARLLSRVGANHRRGRRFYHFKFWVFVLIEW